MTSFNKVPKCPEQKRNFLWGRHGLMWSRNQTLTRVIHWHFGTLTLWDEQFHNSSSSQTFLHPPILPMIDSWVGWYDGLRTKCHPVTLSDEQVHINCHDHFARPLNTFYGKMLWSSSGGSGRGQAVHLIYRFFLTGTPPKSSKYKKS